MFLTEFFGPGYATTSNLLNQEESLDALLSTRKSLVRLGDGEATILEGGDIYFQRNSAQLRTQLRSILRHYGPTSHYLIAVPVAFMDRNSNENSAFNKNAMWRKARFVFGLNVPDNPNLQLLDAFLFREDTKLSNSQIELIWSGYKTVFFVHSNYKYFSDFSSTMPNANCVYVPIRSANAFEQISTTTAAIIDYHRANQTALHDTIALVAGGPAAKILVVRLCQLGIRAIDVGHYFDFKFYNINRSTSIPASHE